MRKSIISRINDYAKLVKDYTSQREWFMADYYAKRIEELERKEENKKRDKVRMKERSKVE